MAHACSKVPGTEAVVVTCLTHTYWKEAQAPVENKTAVGSVSGSSAWSQIEEPTDSGHTWPSGL